jgi:peptidyl-prolyl cis-trans isomerase C
VVGALVAGALVAGALVAAALVAAALAADPRREAKGGRGQLPSLATEPADSVLVWVAGAPITRAGLEARLEDLAPNARRQFETPEGRRMLLDRLVDEQVWLFAAEKAGVEKRPEVIQAIEQFRRQTLIRTHLGEVMRDVPAPSESALVAYYEAHKDTPEYQTREAIDARHIQLAAESEAKQVLRRLQRGEDWDRLVELRSLDGASKENGGRLGRVEQGAGFGPLGRQAALAESAFAASVGRPVGPVKSSVGWHILRVDAHYPAEPRALEAMRPQIQRQLSNQANETYYRAQLEAARAAAGVRWNEAAVDSFLLGRRSAAELFRAAQDAATSDERIAAYQRVVDEYPDSEFAPQSQFMVGFIYSEEKKDYDRAEAAFRALIERYPGSELSVSAQWMLEHMRSDTVPEFDPAEGTFLPAGSDSAGERPR